MNAPDYLKRLKSGLRGFSPKKRTVLLEEIAGHIEMAQNDPGFAADPEARSQRLAAEMGSPGDLSRALRNVYRPSRWLDFLLVVFPTIFFLTGALQNFLFEYIEPWVSRNASDVSPVIYMPVYIASLVILIVVGILRGSKSLWVYWLSLAFLFSLLMCDASRFYDLRIDNPHMILSALFVEFAWLPVLVGLAVWLVLIALHSHETLVRVMALLPIILTAGGLVRVLVWGPFGPTVGYSGGPRVELICSYYIPLLLSVLWPALFYLFQNRLLRWLGLLVYAISLSAVDPYVWVYTDYPGLILLWNLPLLLVVCAWVVEAAQGRHIYLKPDA